MSIQNTKSIENRTRRKANRYGFRLMKSRLRNHRAAAYGMYWLIDGRGNALVWPYNEFGAELADIKDYLDECGGEA